MEVMILNNENQVEAKEFLKRLVDIGIDFKLQNQVTREHLSIDEGRKLIVDLSEEGKSLEEILREFQNDVLPYCTNFASPHFMGFPDAGNSVAAIGGGILYNVLQ